MKNLKQSLTAILLLVAVVSYGQHKMDHKHNHNKGDMKMSDMQMGLEFNNENVSASYQHYVHVKTALVNSDVSEAKKGAIMLVKTLKGVKSSDQALTAANKLAATLDIGEQRKAFSFLSDEMATLVKGNIKSGKVYKDFCPMALNGGAYWLSSDKEIRNPYFGDKMLKCGSVKETIQ